MQTQDDCRVQKRGVLLPQKVRDLSARVLREVARGEGCRRGGGKEKDRSGMVEKGR